MWSRAISRTNACANFADKKLLGESFKYIWWPYQMANDLWIFIFQFGHTVHCCQVPTWRQFRQIMHRKLVDFIWWTIYLASISQVLYSRIAIALWKSSQGIERHIQMQNTPSSFTNAGNSSGANNCVNQKCSNKYEKRPLGATESQVILRPSFAFAHIAGI